MSEREYDRENPTVDKDVDEPAEPDEQLDARRREHLQAYEDEAAESEHIDNFLAGGGSNDEF